MLVTLSGRDRVCVLWGDSSAELAFRPTHRFVDSSCRAEQTILQVSLTVLLLARLLLMLTRVGLSSVACLSSYLFLSDCSTPMFRLFLRLTMLLTSRSGRM